MSNNISNYPRGSEWRKWDLQACTKYYCAYEGPSLSAEQLTTLTSLTQLTKERINSKHEKLTDEEYAKLYIEYLINSTEIDVIAITNHNTGKGIQAIVDYLNSKQDKNIKNKYNRLKVFPGVEVGMADKCHVLVVFNSKSKNKNKYNYDTQGNRLTKLSWDDYIEKFLNAINVPSQRFKDSKPSNSVDKTVMDLLGMCNAWDFIPIFPHIDENKGWYKELPESNRKSTYLHEAFGIVDLKDDTNSALLTILNGKIKDYGDKIIARIQTSDAKSISQIGSKFTWIKADPTFEGLRQIIYEPTERVYRGQEPPSNPLPSKVIQSLTIKNSNGWFEDKEYEVNSSMVSVIGGRGTGKTALLDLIALTANKDWNEIEKNDNSFLKKAKANFPDLTLLLKWKDNSTDNIDLKTLLGPNKNTVRPTDKVVYLSQGFVTQLCSEERIAELQNQIESVVYQKVKDEEKAIYSDFQSFKESKLESVRWKRKEINEKLSQFNVQVKGSLDLILLKVEIEAKIKEKDTEAGKIAQEKKILTDSITSAKKENSKLLQDYGKLSQDKATLEKETAKIAEDIRSTDKISVEIRAFFQDIATKAEEINKQLTNLGIKTLFTVSTQPDNYLQVVKTHKDTLTKSFTDKKHGLDELIKKINALVGQLKLEKTREEKLNTLSDLEKKVKEEQASLQKQLAASLEAEKSIKAVSDNQLKLMFEYFITLFEEKKILEDIYGPLRDTLETVSEEEKGLFRFEVTMNFDYEKMAKTGDRLIDHRKEGIFRNKDQQELLERIDLIKEQILSLDYSASLVADGQKIKLHPDNESRITNFFDSIIKLFRGQNIGIQEVAIRNQVSDYYTLSNFYDWLFSTEYYTLSYSIRFDEKKLDELTPGLKGIALLILYLELDQDCKPILVDQPEENLDNRSAYSTLMSYFRRAKKRRQVFIATHNANLVVNTDSEQIFVANCDKDRKEQEANICYVSGALENSLEDRDNKTVLYSKGIRQHCWYILEGGPEAFQKREQKYCFPNKS